METGRSLPGAAAGADAADVVIPRGADAEQSASKEGSAAAQAPPKPTPGRKGGQLPRLFWIQIFQEGKDNIEGAHNGKFFALPPNKRILVTEGVVTALKLAETTTMKRIRAHSAGEDLPEMEVASEFEEVVRPAYPTLQAEVATASEVARELDAEQIRIYDMKHSAG